MMVQTSIVATLVGVLYLLCPGRSFAPSGRLECGLWRTVHGGDADHAICGLNMFFAEESTNEGKSSARVSASAAATETKKQSVPVEWIVSDDVRFLNAAGAFLVDSLWLGSDHHRLDESVGIADDARMNLVVEQCADLQERYGERMGKRLANASVLGALDAETKELIGLATLKETLLMNNELIESEKAEVIARNAVAALGPKERRLYKDATIATIATELLSLNAKSVCVLSNLSVGKKARRRGIARALCDEVEALAQKWGYSDVHLLVESENTAARSLYEGQLGYKVVATQKEAPALRVDVQNGKFAETQADTLILAKIM